MTTFGLRVAPRGAGGGVELNDSVRGLLGAVAWWGETLRREEAGGTPGEVALTAWEGKWNDSDPIRYLLVARWNGQGRGWIVARSALEGEAVR